MSCHVMLTGLRPHQYTHQSEACSHRNECQWSSGSQAANAAIDKVSPSVAVLRNHVLICCRRVSFPVLHSAAALARLASMAYSGVNSFFIRVLLDKKYALPYR